MADMRTLYDDLLDDIYPYRETYDEGSTGEETPDEMLYNLVCVTMNNFEPYEAGDEIYLGRLNKLIDTFVKSGVDI